MNKTSIILTMLILSTVLVNAAPPTKFDYLRVERQECGIVGCSTYYIATNPLQNPITITNSQILKVNSKIDMLGSSSTFKTEYFNGTNWIDVSQIVSITVNPSEQLRFRISGNFQPVYYNNGQKVSYSIDHIPSFFGFTFPEYDLWNQTYNKCLDINITYDLGNYTQINETFPQRLLLNSTNTNLSAIRSDWGDVRFSKGTCGNVSTDYLHNFVYKNSTDAKVIVYLGNGDIQNNTPAKIAMYYNNSAITHLEPARTAVSFTNVVDVRIFTNDKTTDTNNISGTAFNDSTHNNLTASNIATLVNYKHNYIEKELTPQGVLFSTIAADVGGDDVSNVKGWGTAFNFRLYNASQQGVHYLSSLRNTTDITNTAVYDLYINISNSSTFDNQIVHVWNDTANNNYTHPIAYNWTTDSIGYSTLNPYPGDQYSIVTNGSGATQYDLTNYATDTQLNITYYWWWNSSLTNSLFRVDSAVSDGLYFGRHTATGAPNNWGYYDGGAWTDTGTLIAFGTWVNVTISVNLSNNRWSAYVNDTLVVDWRSPANTLTRKISIDPGGGAQKHFIAKLKITNITSVPQATTINKNIQFNAYYEDETISRSFNIGDIQNNQSYPVGFTVQNTNSTQKRTILVFNHTVLYDTETAWSGSGYPFRQNSTCPDVGDTCLKSITWGGKHAIEFNG